MIRPESTEPVMELNPDPIIIENSKQSRLHQEYIYLQQWGGGSLQLILIRL